MESLKELKAFRNRAYSLLGNGRDGLFDLMDAVLTSRSLPSFAEVSLSPAFQRQWPSVYKSLSRAKPAGEELMGLYLEQLPQQEQLILAGDHTAWPRLFSPTLKERTYEHQPQQSPGSSPVTLGQGYSSLVCVPENQGSWALPLLHERINSFESPIEKGAQQLRRVCEAIETRPLSLWDAEYGCAHFVQLTADIACDKLMRLRSNRVLFGPPPAYSGRGRPRKHGDKFKLNEPATWWAEEQQIHLNHERLGSLRVQCWSGLHFRKTPDIEMTLIQVQRLAPSSLPARHRPLWLIWTGAGKPDLHTVWQHYLRRFCVDHWYRFIKQRLHWCLPHMSTAQQAEAWSDLMPLMSWQLWLARHQAQHHHLPWQKPLNKPTPGRVADAFATFLVAIGTPAQVPKPRGKSPGWPPGKPRPQRQRFPTVKKRYSKPKVKAKAAA